MQELGGRGAISLSFCFFVIHMIGSTVQARVLGFKDNRELFGKIGISNQMGKVENWERE